MARDIAAEVTASILSALDAGTVPWRRPWACIDGQRNLQSGRPYRGVNQLLTQIAADVRGYSSPHWTTFRAAKKAGGAVRKGERGTLVTFWKRLRVKDADAEDGHRIIPMLRHYTVFNLDQVDGIDAPAEAEREAIEPLAAAEAIVAGMPAPPSVGHGQDRAFYDPRTDHVQLPRLEAFHSAEGYHHTGFHELVHSTGHGSRLARPEVATARIQFGSADYSREELVAELGAAMLCGHAGIDPSIEQSASYINGWRKALSDDPKLILQAAGKAQKAADYVLGTTFDAEASS